MKNICDMIGFKYHNHVRRPIYTNQETSPIVFAAVCFKVRNPIDDAIHVSVNIGIQDSLRNLLT